MTHKTIGIFGGVVVVAMFAALTVVTQRPRSLPVQSLPAEEQLVRDVTFEPTVIVGEQSFREQRQVEFEPTVISVPARHARRDTHRVAASLE